MKRRTSGQSLTHLLMVVCTANCNARHDVIKGSKSQACLAPTLQPGMQAALEGALSTLANMAAQSAEAQQAALDSALPDVLVKCLQQAINGVALQQAP